MQIELYEALTSTNVSPDKANVVVEAYRRETETRLATKEDVRVLGAELRSEMHELRSEMHQDFKEQTRWLSGLIFVAAGVIVAAVKLLH